MSNLVVNQSDVRTFCDLVRHCEIKDLVCRIASIVCDFFRLIAGAIADCLGLSSSSSFEGRAIDPIHADQRADAVQTVAPLPDSHMDALDASGIAEVVAPIPENEEADVLQLAASLFNPQIEEKHLIIEAVAAISTDQRADVLHRATPLFCLLTGDWERARIIKAIAAIPVEQRDDVFYHAAPLFSPQMSKSFIITAVAATPADQRADVLHRAASLASPQAVHFSLDGLIEAVAAIPVDQRDDFCYHVAPLFSPQMGNFERGLVIRAAAAIPIDQRVDVFHYASLLLAEPVIAQLHGRDRGKIIQAVAAIPAEQRVERVQRALGQIQLEQLPPNFMCFQIVLRVIALLETSLDQLLPPLVGE